MATRPSLNRLSAAIKDELIAKLLGGETYQAVRQWLENRHGIKTSSGTIGRHGKATRDKFGALIALGMPIGVIVEHRPQIEALGVEQVRQRLLAKLAEKNGALFAYLDDKGGGET